MLQHKIDLLKEPHQSFLLPPEVYQDFLGIFLIITIIPFYK